MLDEVCSIVFEFSLISISVDGLSFQLFSYIFKDGVFGFIGKGLEGIARFNCGLWRTLDARKEFIKQ